MSVQMQYDIYTFHIYFNVALKEYIKGFEATSSQE